MHAEVTKNVKNVFLIIFILLVYSLIVFVGFVSELSLFPTSAVSVLLDVLF